MKYSISDITKVIGYDGDFQAVVEDILDRIDDPTNEDDIWASVDDALIYDDDQWTVMKHYQRPNEADFDRAMEYLVNDIFEIVGGIDTLAESYHRRAKKPVHERLGKHRRHRMTHK